MDFRHDGIEEFAIPETRIDDVKNLLDHFQLLDIFSVLFHQLKVFVGKGRVAEQRRQGFHIIVGVGPRPVTA